MSVDAQAPESDITVARLKPTATSNVPTGSVLYCQDPAGDVRWAPKERFHDIFEDMINGMGLDKASQRVAVEFAKKSMSFADLEALSNKLSRYLKKRGVQEGDVVGVMFDRTPESYASILAISKFGAAFVPMDASFPPDRVKYILEDCGASAVLTMSDFLESFADVDIPIWPLDSEKDEYRRLSPRRLNKPRERRVDDDLAYIIYTSGTTGRPKGCQLNHSSIVNFLRVARDAYGFTPDDRVFQSLTLAFDYSFEEIWTPLFAGARLVPAPTGVNLLGSDLADFLEAKRITAWCSVPTVLASIERDLPDLRLLITSGEACPEYLAKRWFRHDRRLLNLYGPTETTVSCTWSLMTPGRPITIGGPLPTYTALILHPDENGVLPVGEIGELSIAGIGVGEGYLNRPEATAAAFIPDFVGLPNNPSNKIYRSGDLARINDQGEIEYHGRKDTQVKIRGYRIELSEIEEAGIQGTGLAQLVVNPVQIDGEKELVTYYVAPKDRPAPEPYAIQAAMRERLPAYMVPAYFELLDQMPLLPSGKVNRKTLPAPRNGRLMSASGAHIPPRPGMESDLARILGEVLKADKISARANFFDDLGANSMNMARFLAQARKELGVQDASMRMIYKHRTVADLAHAFTGEAHENASANDAEHDPLKSPNMPPEFGQPVDNSPVHVASWFQYAMCGVLQMSYILAMAMVGGMITAIGFRFVYAADNASELFARSIVAGFGAFIGITLFQIATKWIVMGKFKEETIDLWSLKYVRFWIAKIAMQANPMNVFIGSPVYSFYLRLMGAEVKLGALIFSPAPPAIDLFTVGRDSLIRQDCRMHGYHASRGRLTFGSITIGDRVTVNEGTGFDINTSIGDDATLGAISELHRGQHQEGGKTYQGTPVRETDTDHIRVENGAPPSWRQSWGYALTQFMFTTLVVAPIGFMIFVVLKDWFLTPREFDHFAEAAIRDRKIDVIFFAAAALYFAGLILTFANAMLMPRIANIFLKPGQEHPLFGLQYALARTIEKASTSKTLQNIFGDSSMILPYYRMLGYDMRDANDMGSNFGVSQRQSSPFLVKFSRDTFASDGFFLINKDMSRSTFKLSQINVPSNVYMGNVIYYPADARIGENCLIGTKAAIPIDGAMRTDVGILGSPAFEIPRSTDYDEQHEYYKSPGVFEQRLAMKLRSNLLTLGVFFIRNLSTVFIGLWAMNEIFNAFEGAMTDSIVAMGLAYGLLAFGMSQFVPWYFLLYSWVVHWLHPQKAITCSIYEKDFWTHERHWKMNVLREAGGYFGTPIMSWFHRARGTKVGKQLFDMSGGISESFLTTIGDYVAINASVGIQGHSMEDGVFKADHIVIKDRATICLEGFVHYGTDVGEDSVVETGAFVMKGSVVEPGERWMGNPAMNVVRESQIVAPVGTDIDLNTRPQTHSPDQEVEDAPSPLAAPPPAE